MYDLYKFGVKNVRQGCANTSVLMLITHFFEIAKLINSRHEMRHEKERKVPKYRHQSWRWVLETLRWKIQLSNRSWFSKVWLFAKVSCLSLMELWDTSTISMHNLWSGDRYAVKMQPSDALTCPVELPFSWTLSRFFFGVWFIFRPPVIQTPLGRTDDGLSFMLLAGLCRIVTCISMWRDSLQLG
jgi:hypothetical protein